MKNEFKPDCDEFITAQFQTKDNATQGELPAYAFPYAHPAAGRGDVGAEFRGDGGDCITVGIDRTDGGMLALQFGRSGLSENCFSRGELAKVLELAGILFAANGKQPKRGGK